MPQPKIAQFFIEMHTSQPDGQQAWMLTKFRILAGTPPVLGLRVNILVNFAGYPAFLLCSRLQIGKNITNQ